LTPDRKSKGWQYVGAAGNRGPAGKMSGGRQVASREVSVRGAGDRKKEGASKKRDGSMTGMASVRQPRSTTPRAKRREGRFGATQILILVAAVIVAGSLLFLLAQQMLFAGILIMAAFIIFAWRELTKA